MAPQTEGFEHKYKTHRIRPNPTPFMNEIVFVKRGVVITEEYRDSHCVANHRMPTPAFLVLNIAASSLNDMEGGDNVITTHRSGHNAAQLMNPPKKSRLGVDQQSAVRVNLRSLFASPLLPGNEEEVFKTFRSRERPKAIDQRGPATTALWYGNNAIQWHQMPA